MPKTRHFAGCVTRVVTGIEVAHAQSNGNTEGGIPARVAIVLACEKGQNVEAKEPRLRKGANKANEQAYSIRCFWQVRAGRLCCLCPNSVAQEPRFDVTADGGGKLTQGSRRCERFFGRWSRGTKGEFDPGPLWFAEVRRARMACSTRAQVGVFADKISSVAGATRTDASFSNGLSAECQVSMAKRSCLPLHWRWGGGRLQRWPRTTSISAARPCRATNHAVFAYARSRRLRFQLNPRRAWGGSYRLFSPGETGSGRPDPLSDGPGPALRLARCESKPVVFPSEFRSKRGIRLASTGCR